MAKELADEPKEEQVAPSLGHPHVPNLQDPDSLSSYVRAINKYPMLEPEEEYTLAKSWCEKGDNEAARKIVQSHLRLVMKIASGYKGYGLPIQDLVAEGNIGILQALKRFDPNKGFRFSTYAMWWIKASIKDYIMKTWSLVKIGTTAAQKKLFFGLRSAKKRLKIDEEKGLSPDLIEKIAKDMGVSEAEVADMDKRLSGADYSLNSFVGDENESEWLDWLVDETQSHEMAYGEIEETKKRQEIFDEALVCLDQREHNILVSRRMTEPPKTLEDIAIQYGISRERVRQIEMKAFHKLQKHARDLAAKKMKL